MSNYSAFSSKKKSNTGFPSAFGGQSKGKPTYTPQVSSIVDPEKERAEKERLQREKLAMNDINFPSLGNTASWGGGGGGGGDSEARYAAFASEWSARDQVAEMEAELRAHRKYKEQLHMAQMARAAPVMRSAASRFTPSRDYGDEEYDEDYEHDYDAYDPEDESTWYANRRANEHNATEAYHEEETRKWVEHEELKKREATANAAAAGGGPRFDPLAISTDDDGWTHVHKKERVKKERTTITVVPPPTNADHHNDGDDEDEDHYNAWVARKGSSSIRW